MLARWIIRISLVAAVVGGAAWVVSRWLTARSGEADLHFPPPISGPGLAVDHARMPGVPPESNDDYEDMLDHASADSFPASDPSATW